MKRESLITNVVLAAAIVLLYILHFTSKPKESVKTGGETATATVHSGQVVFIQLDSLVENYDMYHDLRAQFESKAQTIQNDLNKRGRALENDIKEFQTKVQKGLITRMQAENQQVQLAQREQELQQYMQEKQIEMSEEEAVIIRRVMDALQTYVNQMNEDGKYSLILTTSGLPGTIIYGQDALDITPSVIEGLNSQYVTKRGSGK